MIEKVGFEVVLFAKVDIAEQIGIVRFESLLQKKMMKRIDKASLSCWYLGRSCQDRIIYGDEIGTTETRLIFLQ